jgi:two-component system, OmpR family, heavy metal sensor histidine kinase CusS
MSSKTGPEPARWSLAARLAAWYTGASFLLILAVTSFLYWVLISNLEREDDQYLADKIESLRRLLHEHPDDRALLEREVEWEWRNRQYGQIFVRIVDAEVQKESLIEAPPGWSRNLDLAAFPGPSDTSQTAPFREVEVAGGGSYRLAAGRADGPAYGRNAWFIQVAMDRTYEESILARYRRYLWVTLGSALILCGLVSYWLVHSGLRPLHDISAKAEQIRSSTLHERIQTPPLPRELAELAFTINSMLDRLQESFERLQQFSADVAHELRTPLSNLRSEAEVVLAQPRQPEEYSRALSSCLEEGNRLAGLVDTLLFLARAEQPRAELQRTRIDLAAELALLREFFEAAAGEKGIALQVEAAGPVWAEVDRTLLQRAVSNLVTNALTYAPPGATVTLAAKVEGGLATVSVADTGVGIPSEHLPRIFDRFYRIDAARTGSSGHVGLGLAIVQSIARLHGGRVSAASEPGHGTEIRMELPTSPSAVSASLQ